MIKLTKVQLQTSLNNILEQESGLTTALDTVVPLVYKNTEYQKCVVHLKRNILNKVASKHEEKVAEDLMEVLI